MATQLEDLDMPKTVITRVIKGVLPEGMSVASDSRLAVTKATTVFISYISSMANDLARSKNHKTITAQHVYQALEEAEFEEYVPDIRALVEERAKFNKAKRLNRPAAGKADAAMATAEADEDPERIGDDVPESDLHPNGDGAEPSGLPEEEEVAEDIDLDDDSAGEEHDGTHSLQPQRTDQSRGHTANGHVEY
ncbi:Sequence-specific DNA binding [Tieghemiomyces parasiticus]|uniref:DNA polymerase epsilon subunit D n=1 Tax=Tieghemiomyces parasiticus TaxID=78921 RepID=A0A9W8DHN6_9FUNG|nr:Sequence-specific DNA binding [Tieghemiomyces parasiticus]